jgi:hypothetical protein
MMSKQWAESHGVPLVTRTEPKIVENFNGQRVEGAGWQYTFPVTLRYESHYTKETFEIGPMEDSSDVMLPYWWIVKHGALSGVTEENDKLQFTSKHCHQHCTKAAVSSFSIEYDDSILKFGTDPRWIGVIGSMHVSAAHEIEVDWVERIPWQYRDFQTIYNGETANALPPHRSYDHAIDLKDGEQPPWGPIYALSEKELSVLKDYLKEMLDSGKIRPSKSPAGAPILFVPKPHGRGLRLCVDYRGLNRVTIMNRYPLPLMNELRDRVAGSRIFTKIDLKAGYNLIRIKPGDEWKTAFRTRYGHYEYLVMPFGLANAPATFQDMMNEILRDLIDHGVVVYIDDILIYTETEEEHIRLTSEVLRRLQENNLAIAPDKCEWHQKQVEFLGYIISGEGVSMSEDKIDTILKWEIPESVKDVQSFLGFANFYRRFIEGFSKICYPLTELTKKTNEKFDWKANPRNQIAFDMLKKYFTEAPILRHFEPVWPVVIETDASDFAIGAVLSQVIDGRLHPIAYHSRKMDKAEINYEIHDKEMLAVVSAFKEWRRYLEGAAHPISVYTDHKNLEYFTTTKILNRRQARWAQELAGYDFKIFYRPGSANGKPDALSRRSEYRPKKGGGSAEENENQPIHRVLRPDQLVTSEGETVQVTAMKLRGERIAISSAKLRAIPVVKFNSWLLEAVVSAANNDAAWQEEYVRAMEGNPSPDISFENEALYYKGRLWIPDDLQLKKDILEAEHDSKVAGHMGQDKTIELVR